MKNFSLFLLAVCCCIHTFAQTPQWHYIGDSILSDDKGTNGVFLAIHNNTPYIAYNSYCVDHYCGAVKQFDGIAWVALDTAGIGDNNYDHFSFSSAGNPQLVYYDNRVKKFGLKRLVNHTWVTVTESPEVTDYPNYTAFVTDGDQLFVAFTDPAVNERATVWKFDGNTWSVMGQPGISNGRVYPILLTISDGVLWLAYQEASFGKLCFVKKYDGTNWQSVGGMVFDGDHHGHMDFTVCNGIPYVAHEDSLTQQRLSVLKFDGNAWVLVGQPMFTDHTFYPKIAVDAANQQPYVAFDDSGQGFWGLSVMTFDGNEWVYLGNRGFTSFAMYSTLAIQDGAPYLAYQQGTFVGGASLQVFSPHTSSHTPYATGLAFDILPNPVTAGALNVHFQSTTASDVEVHIMDMAGRVLQTKTLHLKEGLSVYQFNTGALNPGFYIIRAQSKDGREYCINQFEVVR